MASLLGGRRAVAALVLAPAAARAGLVARGQKAHGVRRRAATPHQIGHDAQRSADVVEERLVAGAQVVEARLTVGAEGEAVLGTLAVAGEAHVALAADARQSLELVEAEARLLLAAGRLQ